MRKRRRTRISTRWANIPFVRNIISGTVYCATTIRFAFRTVLTSGDAAWTARCCSTMMINHDRSDDGIKLEGAVLAADSFNSFSTFAIYLNSLENIPILFDVVI